MRRPLGFGGAAAAAAAAASLTLGEFRAGQLSLFLTLAVLAVSLDLVWGYSGILSLGQLLPFGIAAYTTARVATAAPSLSLPGLLLAAAVGAAVAYGVGIAAFRRRPTPVVVGLLTLVLSLTLEQIAKQWRDVTGGFNGLTDVPRITVFGSEFPDRAQDLFISVVAVAVITVVGLLVTRPVGAVLIGIRDNERRTEALGYDTVAVKVWIFTIGGAVAGIAGALYVHRTGFVSPQIFGFALATNVVLWTLVGGRGTIVGPVLGSLAINFASATLADVWLQYLDPRHRGDLRGGGGAHSRRACPQRAAHGGPPRPAQSAPHARPDRIRRCRPRPSRDLRCHRHSQELRVLPGARRRDTHHGRARAALPDRPQWRRQVHPAGHSLRPAGLPRGLIVMLGRDCKGLRAWEFARHGVSRKFQSPKSSVLCRWPRTWRWRPGARRRHRGGSRAVPGRRAFRKCRCGSSSAPVSTNSETRPRAVSPTATSSGWRSPWRWRDDAASCCWTNRRLA